MLSSCLAGEKESRKVLVNLLYKDDYCLCIPEPELIKLHINTVSATWMQTLLLKKNTHDLSIIPRFMFIFIQNKGLNTQESECLRELLHLLIVQAQISTIDQIFLENQADKTSWVNSLWHGLMQFTLSDFIKSQESQISMLALAECLEFFLEKVSVNILHTLNVNAQQKAAGMQSAAQIVDNESLCPQYKAYLTNITKKLTGKLLAMARDDEIVQIQDELPKNQLSKLFWPVRGCFNLFKLPIDLSSTVSENAGFALSLSESTALIAHTKASADYGSIHSMYNP